MHVAIVTAVYPPEPVVSARMAQDLAQYLVRQGHRVTAISPQPSRPVNAPYDAYRHHEPLVRLEEGVEVVRLPSFTAPLSRLLPRLYESWSFGRHSCEFLARMAPAADVVYLNTWPLLGQALLMECAQKMGIPVALQIMDVYPESLVEKLPLWARKAVSAPLLGLDARTAGRASSIVVISDNMRRTYMQTRRIPEERVATVPTWQDDARFDKLPERGAACAKYGVPEDLFTFLYLGNIGPVAGVEFLISAFHETRLDGAQLVIVGDGSTKERCVRLSLRLGTRNVRFVSDPDAANVPLLQSMADVFLLPMKGGSGMSSIPSKLPAYLFSAKPVLATVDAGSDTARLIREAGCGWTGDSEDLDWLVARMREVASLSKEELSALGAKGRAFGRRHYSKIEGVRRLADVITGLASAPEASPRATAQGATA